MQRFWITEVERANRDRSLCRQEGRPPGLDVETERAAAWGEVFVKGKSVEGRSPQSKVFPVMALFCSSEVSGREQRWRDRKREKEWGPQVQRPRKPSSLMNINKYFTFVTNKTWVFCTNTVKWQSGHLIALPNTHWTSCSPHYCCQALWFLFHSSLSLVLVLLLGLIIKENK